MNDLELQQYLFDLQGYLVIENALSPKAVAALNQIIDEQNLPPPGKSPRFGSAPTLESSLLSRRLTADGKEHEARTAAVGSGFLNWGKPFCDLLDHAAIMPVLRFRFGEAFRLDRLYGMYMRKGMGYGKLHADYGATARIRARSQANITPSASTRYTRASSSSPGRWLTPDPGMADFAVFPAAQKQFQAASANQRQLRRVAAGHHSQGARGSVILFSESLTHGTATWQADHERRTLLYKYCVSHIAWTSKRVETPTKVELTPRQQLLLRDPGDPLIHFPSLFAEGTV